MTRPVTTTVSPAVLPASSRAEDRLANLSTIMHRKATELMTRAPDLFDMATKYYKRNGRGAVFVKFRDVEQLLERSVKVVLLYIPLEQSWLLEYEELPRQVVAYEPSHQYVLFMTVSTDLVEGGELMQASTAHVAPTYQLLAEQPDSIELVSNSPAEFARLMERESSTETQAGTKFISVCSYCYAGAPKYTCSRCSLAQYCSKECQRDHWRATHKINCNCIALD